MPEPELFEELQGRGVKATVEGRPVLVGNAALLSESGVAFDAESDVASDGRTPVHVAIDGRFVGVIFIADTLRPGVREALAELKASGIQRVVIAYR